MLRIKWITITLLLMVIDIGPFPFTASLFLYILLARPHWFKRLIDHLYPPE